jgi:putative endopeptidase
LSENIADLGGMGIALDALHSKLDSMKLTGDERKQMYRDFFTGYATSWRLKDKKKKRIQALIMDRHAPPSLRVNLIVSQFQEWYDAFDVQPDDEMYIEPEKRIRIF